MQEILSDDVRLRSGKTGILFKFRASITAADKNGSHSRSVGGSDVDIAVSNHERFCKVDVHFGRCSQQHSGFWFSAIAIIFREVRAEVDAIQMPVKACNLLPENAMHFMNCGFLEVAAANAGLVRHKDC